MEKDKDIIEIIINEQPTNNKKIKFAYWDNLAKDLSPLFIKISSAVCIMIVLGVFFVGFFIPKNDNKITKRLEKLQNTNSEYITAQNNYSSLSDEINTLNSDLADKKKNYEEFTTSQNGLEKINDENDKLEKEKEELQNTVNTKQSTLDSLNNQASSTSQSTLTLTSGTYAVGENIKAGKYTIMGSGSIAISSLGKARVNSNLTADGKDYVLNDDETIKIKGKAQFIPIK